METNVQHQYRPNDPSNLTKPVAVMSSTTGGGDRFLVLKQKPRRETRCQHQPHPWGPDSQGLPEVQTQAGDTATMGSSTWAAESNNVAKRNSKFAADSTKWKAEKVLERNSSERSWLLSKAFRLDQEEEHDDFHSIIVRRGIETARRKHRTTPQQQWKTPYEVDAPRPIMLPRDHPQESSSGGNTSMDGNISIEQQIWRGIEQLMVDAFSSDDSSAATSINPLPAALVRAMSNKSVLSFASSDKSRRSEQGKISQDFADDIEMANLALNTFVDILMPKGGDDDCSLPTLVSWRGSMDGSTNDFDSQSTNEQMALRNFMNVLLDEVETSHKPASLSLWDLFAWTLRVNVDAYEKQFYLKFEEGLHEQDMKVLKEDDRRQQAFREEQIAEDLRRHEQLLREKEAEEAELERLEKEGKRLEEMLRLKFEEAARLRLEESENIEDFGIGDGEIVEYMKPLNDATHRDQLPSTPAGRRRAEAKRRQEDLQKQHIPSLDEPLLDENSLTSDSGSSSTTAHSTGESLIMGMKSEHSGESRHLSPSSSQERGFVEYHGIGSPDGTPRSVNPRSTVPRDISSGTIPTFSSLETEMQTSESFRSHDTLEPLRLSNNPIWASIGGVPIVVSSDDDRSIDPLQLPHRGARRSSTHSMNNSRRQVYSSTELKNMASFLSPEGSSGTISTLTAKSVPMLLPSESKRTLKAASMYESSEFSIDPSTLPNLANFRLSSKPMEQASLKPSHGPQWAAIGGRQIMMSTGENGISSTNTNVSPESAESGVLPSSFHSKNKLSSSGSVSTPSTRTLHVIASNRNLMQHVETGSVLTSEDMPDLKSLSDASLGDSSDSERKGISHHSPVPKLFASKYSTRGTPAVASAKQTEEKVLFKDSLIEKGQSVFSPSFVNRMETTAVLPSSFLASTVAPPNLEPKATDESIVYVSLTDKPAGDDKKKKEKKKGKKKKGKKKEKKLRDSLTASSSQRNLVVSAMGDVFLDDVQAQSLHNLPESHFDSQMFQTDSNENSSFVGTEVRSFGSAGDIHLGSAIVEVSDREDEESNTSDMSIDVDLQLDELLIDGKRQRIPETKDSWKRRRQGRRSSIGNSLLKTVKKFCWPPSRRKQAGKISITLDQDLANSNGHLCLLHELDSPYDRTPVLRDVNDIVKD